MTDKLKKLVKKVLEYPHEVDRILNDPDYGRKSVSEDFDCSMYYAQEVIKEIQENPDVDVDALEINEDKEAEVGQPPEPKDPVDANNWKIPEDWVYEKDYVYNAKDDKYIFTTREFGNIVKSGSWVKNVVKAYSNWDGDQDTINEICRRFGITRGLFTEIKSILGLTHDHEPFTPEEIREKSAEEMAQEAYQMKRFRTKQKFDKKDWKETQKEAKKWRNLKNSILDEVALDAPAIQVNPIDPAIPESRDSVTDITLNTGDWHLGAVAENLPSLPDFNPGILKGYIDQMVNAVRHDFPEARIHIQYKGDTMETVTGMNHADSWKNIADGYYGAKAILESEKYLAHLIESTKAKSFKAVTGNHGRITSNRRKDHSGEAELIVYSHLQDRYSDVDVEYSEYKIHDIINGIGYIIYHGHHKFSRKAKEQVVQAVKEKFGDKADYVMVLQGHTHCRNILEDHNNFRHQVVPSLFTGGDYNERGGFQSLPGFIVTYRHPITGKIQVNDYTL